MRKSVLVVGGVLWLVAGAAALFVFGPFGSRSPDSSAAPTGPVKIVDPTGRQAIRIAKPAEPEPIAIPPDWEPPLVEGWTLTNQAGESVTADALRDKPYVAAFVFSRCYTHCPDLVRRIYDLNEALADVDVRFVTVTVDPEYDTVEHFAKYAANFTDDPDRWMFLTGPKTEILELAKYGFKQMRSEPLDAESFLGPKAAHSLRLMHVGLDGRLIGTYHFQREADVQALKRVLAGKQETSDDHKPLPPAEMLAPVMFLQASDADAAPVSAAAGEPGRESEDSGASLLDDPLANLPAWARRLPSINAGLNGVSSILLVLALVAIKQGKKTAHRNLIFGALAVSAAFLSCYLAYHFALGQYTESHGKPFVGGGAARVVYYSILIPHVILAAAVPFLAAVAVWRALKQEWEAHKRIVKYAYPIWMFVSVTGVVIYAMLYHWPSPA